MSVATSKLKAMVYVLNAIWEQQHICVYSNSEGRAFVGKHGYTIWKHVKHMQQRLLFTVAVLTGNLHYIHGCRIITDKMDVIVYQVSGWEQATKHPDHEAWAAPFTWWGLANVTWQRSGVDTALTGFFTDRHCCV